MQRSALGLDVRTVDFSRDVIVFCKAEPATIIVRPIIAQLVRSVTSIGANYAEATNAASRADFRNKIFLAKKEASETKYWLTLMADLSANKEVCKNLLQECQYILMTLQKIISTMNNR